MPFFFNYYYCLLHLVFASWVCDWLWNTNEWECSEMCLHFLQGEGVDPTQTSTSSRPQQSRESKTKTQYTIYIFIDVCTQNMHTHRKWTSLLRRVAYLLNYLLNYLNGCVLLQAVLDFHSQVGNVVTHVSEQYKELFGTRCKLSEDSSQEQVKVQLMGALNVSGRYFTFKEQMKVRTTAHIPGGWIKLAGTWK